MEGIHALMAEFYSANLAGEIRKGMTQKAKMGGWPTKAPIGYLNVREKIAGKEIAKVVLDPERALLVREAFRLYATGEYSLPELQATMHAKGLTSPYARRPGAPVVGLQARRAAHQPVLRRRRAVGRRPLRGPAQGAHPPEPVRPGPGDAPSPRRRRGTAATPRALPEGPAALRGVRAAPVAHARQRQVPVLLLPRAARLGEDRMPPALRPGRRRRGARGGPVSTDPATSVVGEPAHRGTRGGDRRASGRGIGAPSPSDEDARQARGGAGQAPAGLLRERDPARSPQGGAGPHRRSGAGSQGESSRRRRAT